MSSGWWFLRGWLLLIVRDWEAVTDAPGFEGLLIRADERADITKLTWHPRGRLGLYFMQH